MPKLPAALVDACSRLPSSSSSFHTTAATCKKFKRQKEFKAPRNFQPRDDQGPREGQYRSSEGEGAIARQRERPDVRSDDRSGIGRSWLGRETESEPPVQPRRKGWLTDEVQMPADFDSLSLRSDTSRLNAPSPTPSSSSSRSGADYGEFKPIYTDPSLLKFGHASKSSEIKEPWMPTKKLTQSAMAGLKALHESDPVKYSRDELSERFGISYESVRRITRSKFRDGHSEGLEASGSKWDQSAERGERLSPIPALRRAGIEPQPKPVRTGFGFGGGSDRAPAESSRSGGFGMGGTSGKASSFGLRSGPSASPAKPNPNPMSTNPSYRPQMLEVTNLDEASRILPPAPTAFQATLSPFNGPRGLRSAIKHMMRSDAKREIEMEEVTAKLSPEERRLAEEIEAEREEAYMANKAALKRKKSQHLRLQREGTFQ